MAVREAQEKFDELISQLLATAPRAPSNPAYSADRDDARSHLDVAVKVGIMLSDDALAHCWMPEQGFGDHYPPGVRLGEIGGQVLALLKKVECEEKSMPKILQPEVYCHSSPTESSVVHVGRVRRGMKNSYQMANAARRIRTLFRSPCRDFIIFKCKRFGNHSPRRPVTDLSYEDNI
jgi:hypothetical protein